MFPLADARGRVIGFQARRLHDDDPLRGKYVNTPESELFKKGNVLYGLHLARPAIAKQDRAIVVEGNTDVIALRQAGVEPVVASMGTALTEHQLRELGRLTKRLFLCFDADAAGQEATLRGMELAVRAGIRRPRRRAAQGEDPADAPDTFAARLGSAESYLHYRVRIALERAATGRRRSSGRGRSSRTVEDSPERQEALRLLADRLDLPRETLAGLAPARRRAAAGGAAHAATPRLLEAGLQRERDLLAAVVRNPALARRARCADAGALRRRRSIGAFARCSSPGRRRTRSWSPCAPSSARAPIGTQLDERTGKELLLRLHERRLRRELQGADLVRATELQARLAKVHSALAELV